MAIININNIDDKVFSQHERISKYLHGEMSKEEEKTFLEDVKKDPELKARAIAAARLAKGISDVGKEQDKEVVNAFRIADKESVMEVAKKVVSEEKTTARIITLKQGLKLMSIAASLLFIVFVGFQYKEYNHVTSLGNNNAVLLDEQNIRGNESPVIDEILSLNKNVIEKKDLDNTTRRLEVLWELSKMDTYNDYTDFAPEIGWNLSMAYLKNNEKKKAKTILQEMSTMYDKDTALGQKILKLLDEL
jgi:hypothetical protein